MSAAIEIAPRPAGDGADFPAAAKLRSRDIFRLLPRAWPFIVPYRRHLLYLFLAMIPALPTGLFGIYLSQILFDAVGHGKPLTPIEAAILRLPLDAPRDLILWRACIVMGIAILISIPYGSILFGYAVWILQRISNLFRVNLYTRLQELSVRFHAEEKIGDAIFRMFQDSAAIPHIIGGLVIQPIRWIPFAVANLVWLFMYNSAMAWIAIVLLPLDLAMAWMYGTALRRAFIAERETTAAATTRIEETLASIKAVKAFGREPFETDRYARDNWDAFGASRSARLMLARYRVATNTVRGLAYVGALYIGAHLVLNGGTAGAVAVAASLGLFQGSLAVFARMSARMREAANLWGSMQDVGVATARVFEMLSRPAEDNIKSGDRIPPAHPRAIAFEHVGFGYDPRSPVLSDVSFEARAGEITAIAGPSGSGKSTIVAMILRFFDPVSGRILVDGIPLDDFEIPAWRGLVSVALQDNPLFTASMRDNIAYGRPAASDGQVLAAVARAGLADFVRSLPAGLDTVLGEKGAKLSTGQAQRIGVARAILRDAPILILDEPTSALDSRTEDAIMRGIRDWVDERPRARIAIIATHRTTTAACANRVYRIENGKIVAAELSEIDLPARPEASDA